MRAQAALALVRAREAAVAPLVDDPGRSEASRRARGGQDDSGAARRCGGRAAVGRAGIARRGAQDAGDRSARDACERQQAVAPLLGPLLSPTSTPELRAAAAAALEKISGHVPDPPRSPATAGTCRATPAGAIAHEDDAGRGAGRESGTGTPSAKQSMPISYDATGASLAVGRAAGARPVSARSRRTRRHRRLYLTTLLQAAKFRGGLDKPLPTGAGTAYAVAAHHGVDVVEDRAGRRDGRGLSSGGHRGGRDSGRHRQRRPAGARRRRRPARWRWRRSTPIAGCASRPSTRS